MDHLKYAAPDDQLELVRQFVNTHDVEEDKEDLADPQALGVWLEERGFDPGRISVAALDRAITLREALRALLLANGGAPLDERAIATLNSIADQTRLAVRFETAEDCGLEPTCDGSDAALGELLAIVFRAMSDGTWTRLKVCREETCQWAFYDRSRNRSGTWCSMEVCGNRAKARAYRRRHSGGS